MRHGAAVSFRLSFSVAEGVVGRAASPPMMVKRRHRRGRGVMEIVTPESAGWRPIRL
jgi:hypothetical protein